MTLAEEIINRKTSWLPGEKRSRDRQIRKETDTRLKDGITLMRMERNRNGILMIQPSKSTEQTNDSKKETPASDKKQASKKKISKKKSNKKEEQLPEGGQYQIKGSGNGNQNGELSETSDMKAPFVILILLIASGSISAGLLFRNYNRRK